MFLNTVAFEGHILCLECCTGSQKSIDRSISLNLRDFERDTSEMQDCLTFKRFLNLIVAFLSYFVSSQSYG